MNAADNVFVDLSEDRRERFHGHEKLPKLREKHDAGALPTH